MNKFIILMQGLLLLTAHGFSQEESPSFGEIQIKIETGRETYYEYNKRFFDKNSRLLTDTLTQKKLSGLETILKMSYTVLNTEP